MGTFLLLRSLLIRLLHTATSLISMPDACACSSFGGALILIFFGADGSTSWKGCSGACSGACSNAG